MGSIISNTNKDYVNKNWGDLKCSPIGPLLQTIGIAPGNPTDTANECQSNAFSSQFNSSMTDQLNVTNKLNEGMSSMNGTMNKFRSIIANIQQKIFEDLSKIATIIFSIYVKIGNIIMVLNKNMMNILGVFKHLVNTGSAIIILLMTFMNLIRIPLNGIIKFINGFRR